MNYEHPEYGLIQFGKHEDKFDAHDELVRFFCLEEESCEKCGQTNDRIIGGYCIDCMLLKESFRKYCELIENVIIENKNNKNNANDQYYKKIINMEIDNCLFFVVKWFVLIKTMKYINQKVNKHNITRLLFSYNFLSIMKCAESFDKLSYNDFKILDKHAGFALYFTIHNICFCFRSFNILHILMI